MELAQPFFAVRRVPDRRPAPLQQGADEAPNVVVVVDYENPRVAHTLFIPRASAVPSKSAEGACVATILIVDPDPATRSLLELLCLRLGHNPIGPREWVDGREPDLLLLEPASRPGVRLARGVRRRFPQLPILCVSIDGPSDDSRELGPAGHVMKPFRRTQLERALEQALIPTAVVPPLRQMA